VKAKTLPGPSAPRQMRARAAGIMPATGSSQTVVARSLEFNDSRACAAFKKGRVTVLTVYTCDIVPRLRSDRASIKARAGQRGNELPCVAVTSLPLQLRRLIQSFHTKHLKEEL
jgi:hypothetical protein